MIGAIAAHQVLSLRRQRTFIAILVTFLAMAALAGVLGWSSHRTIVRVYEEAVRMVAARGERAPANPFDVKPPLALLSNMAIYVPLIGALLALIVGHLSFADDHSGGLGRMIFTRAVSRSAYVFGKVVAAAQVLAVVLVACFLISALSLFLVNNRLPSGGNLLRLGGFYALAWLYLMLFALAGMTTALMTKRRSLALLSAISIWLVVTFALPQFTSGLRPQASLNPVSDPVSSSQTFFKITAKARPFSVAEQYKEASARILETASAEPTTTTVVRVLPIAAMTIGLLLLALALARSHDYSSGRADD